MGGGTLLHTPTTSCSLCKVLAWRPLTRPAIVPVETLGKTRVLIVRLCWLRLNLDYVFWQTGSVLATSPVSDRDTRTGGQEGTCTTCTNMVAFCCHVTNRDDLIWSR